MYRLVKKLGVGIWYNPIFYDGFLIANKKDKTIQIYETDKLKEVKGLFPIDITYITHHENNLFISTEIDTFLFDTKYISNEGMKMSGVRVLPSFVSDQFIFSNYQTDLGLKIVRYNYKDFRLEQLFNYQIGRDALGIDGRLIFSEKNFFARKVFCIDQDTGQEQWTLDVNEFDKAFINEKEIKSKIEGSLFAYDNSIIVPVSGNKLLRINCVTGQVIWKSENINPLLKLDANILINVSNSYYREISPDTGETLVEYEMKSEYEKHDFTVTGPLGVFTVTDTYIFIVHAMGYKMGCINRSTGKIDWSTAVGDGKVTLPHAPIFYKDKLYVLDDEGTLHVYDRN